MNQMTERLFEALAIRKQKQEQDRKEKLEKINVLGEDIATVPTSYQQGEPKIAWICPVPSKKVAETKTITTRVVSIDWDSFNTYDVPKLLEDREINKTITHTSYKRDWDNWETPNEKAKEIWQGLDDILSGKREWPEKGEKILYGKQNSTVCPQCGKRGVSKRLLQTRSADEAPTEILTCIHCGYTWRAKD